MPSVFLSHSSKDKFFVRELAEKLRSYDIQVWLDEAELNIGDSLTEKIGAAIEEADYLCVVLSQNSINSQWVQRELQVAMQKELEEKRVVVLPLLLEKVDIPPFLRDKKYADFTDYNEYEESIALILRSLGVPEEKVPRVEEPKVEKTPLPVLSKSERTLATFDDIRIFDLDLDRSYNPDETKVLYNMYLKLSSSPPLEWEQIFIAERRFPRHTMWRGTWLEGQYIVVYCVPDELEKYHLRDLREDTENANRKYRQYLTEEAQKEIRELSADEDKKQQFRDLKQRLGFD